jgi:YVTN family beta-propeller protein
VAAAREDLTMTARRAGALAGLALLLGATAAQALDETRHLVFVPSRASAEVALIDSVRDVVIARVPVGQVPHQVAVSHELGLLVASNTADDTISVIDLESLAPRATIALDVEPEHMAIAPGGRLIAVGNIGAGTVSLVSLDEAREIARIPGFHQPHTLTFTGDGKRLYVANLGADLVTVVDVAKQKIVEEIRVGEPQLVASRAPGDEEYQGVIDVTPTMDGRLGFAAFGEGDSLAVIDLASGETLKTLPLGSLPWRAFPTTDGRYMIVPNNGDMTVSIVDARSLEEVARLPGAANMTGVNTGFFESVAFVISRGEDRLIVIDLERLEPAGEISLPGTPETGVTTPDGTKLYVALSGAGKVAVIDTRARKVLKLIDGVGEEPWGAHMTGAVNYCH